MRRPLAIFDLDGTLLDTAPDLLAALNGVLADEGLPPMDRDAIRGAFGHGARAMIAAAYSAAGRPLGDAEAEALVGRFLDRYGAHYADRTQPFGGARAAMDRLGARGARFAVCTNKRMHLALPLLSALGFDGRFDAVVGGDSLPVRKPDPEHVRATVAAAGAELDDAVMIGDSDADIAAARGAGIPVIGVSFGYSPEPVASLAPDAVIDHFDDLDAALAAVSPAFRRLLP